MYPNTRLTKQRGLKHQVTPQITNLKKSEIFKDYEIPTRVKILLEKPTASLKEQLKHSWNGEDCSDNIFVKNDGLTAHRRQSVNTTDCIRGKVGFSKGLHAWEIVWYNDQRGTHAYVGVATLEATLQGRGYQSLVGLDSNSWGFNINKGITLHNSVTDMYPKYYNGRNR